MQVQLNTDSNVVGPNELALQLEGEVHGALSRFADRITRVEVHLSDLTSDNKTGGNDKRCVMEARLASRQPMSVSHEASTVSLAIDGACDKLLRALDRLLGKLDADQRSGARQANDDAASAARSDGSLGARAMNRVVTLGRPDLAQLLSDRAGPCVSIYQPTHRQHPDNQQDPIRFLNLLKQAAESLQHEHPAAEVDSALAPFHALADDADFWNHTTEGLAVFGAADLFQVVRLQRPVRELVIVAMSFHVKPLLRIVQSADRFQVLALNRHDVRLYEGNRDALDELELAADVPRTATEVLGDDLPEPEGIAHSYGTGPAASGGGSGRGTDGTKTGGMRHGHGSKSEVIDQQTERFFRAVDRGVIDHHSKSRPACR